MLPQCRRLCCGCRHCKLLVGCITHCFLLPKVLEGHASPVWKDVLRVQVKQVACGMHHTLLLAARGDGEACTPRILGCGMQRHGQLGPVPAGKHSRSMLSMQNCEQPGDLCLCIGVSWPASVVDAF